MYLSDRYTIHITSVFLEDLVYNYILLFLLAPEVVDPQIVNRMLAMFLAYYCNIADGINDEQQTDGILQTLLSQLKDHKGNLASITTGMAAYTIVHICTQLVLRILFSWKSN